MWPYKNHIESDAIENELILDFISRELTYQRNQEHGFGYSGLWIIEESVLFQRKRYVGFM